MNFDDKIFREIGPCNRIKWGFHFWSTESYSGPNTRASCRIRRIAGCNAPGLPGTFSPTPRVSYPDVHHGTCVTHVLWCIPGSLTNGFLWCRCGENVPGIPGACATRNFTYRVRDPFLLKSLIWFRHVRGTWFNQECSCDGINQDDWYRLNAFKSWLKFRETNDPINSTVNFLLNSHIPFRAWGMCLSISTTKQVKVTHTPIRGMYSRETMRILKNIYE